MYTSLISYLIRHTSYSQGICKEEVYASVDPKGLS